MKNRRAKVLIDGELAGFLAEDGEGYTFIYEDGYLQNTARMPISLTLPKAKKEFHSKNLFSFFFGLLAEGENKEIQCRTLKIDERDHFTRLLKTAHTETIGAITVQEENADH